MEYPKIDTILERDPKTFKVYQLEPHLNNLKNPLFAIPKFWEWTEKIDGTNIRVMKGNCLEILGRTDTSEIPKKIVDYIFDDLEITIPKLEEIFGDKNVIIYGEGYGGKIQGGEKDKHRGGKYSETEKFIVFDILVEGEYWLKREDIEDVCAKLGLDVVPWLGAFSIHEACRIAKHGFESKLAPVKAEGLVGCPEVPLFDSEHRRLICKIKTKDF